MVHPFIRLHCLDIILICKLRIHDKLWFCCDVNALFFILNIATSDEMLMFCCYSRVTCMVTIMSLMFTSLSVSVLSMITSIICIILTDFVQRFRFNRFLWMELLYGILIIFNYHLGSNNQTLKVIFFTEKYSYDLYFLCLSKMDFEVI